MALKLDVEMLRARAGKRASRLAQRVGQALDTIDATIRSVRAIMNDLHPSTLELGLPAALEWLVEQFELRTGIACALGVAGDGPLPDARRTTVIFRIVQEALLFIVRHLGAGLRRPIRQRGRRPQPGAPADPDSDPRPRTGRRVNGRWRGLPRNRPSPDAAPLAPVV